MSALSGQLQGTPLGWTPAGTASTTAYGFGCYGPAEIDGTDSNIFPSWAAGGMYGVVGDGATPIAGMIQQGAATDWEGEPIMQPNTAYSARVMLGALGAPTSGQAVIELYSPTQGSLGLLSVAAAGLTESLAYYSGPIGTTGATVPSDLMLRVYVNGTLSAGAYVFFDELAVYPTGQPYRTAEVRVSYAENPEAFDGDTGLLESSDFGNKLVTTVGMIRTTLYLLADPGFAETSDNGIGEPGEEGAGWQINLISGKVGTPSVEGVANGEEWILMADRKGLHISNGNEPTRISQEIQPNWNTITTAGPNANGLWMVNDTASRRVFIGVPSSSGADPAQMLMMNYIDLNTSWELAEQKPLHLSYSGKMVSWDMSRKWSPWNISANSCAIVEDQNGNDVICFGNNLGTAKIYELTTGNTQLSDDGAAINSIYYTFFFVNRDMEQMLQMGLHRKIYDYLVGFVTGAGTLAAWTEADALNSPRVMQLANRILQAVAGNDREWQVNWTAERTTFAVQTAAVGAFFSLSKMVVRMKSDPWMPIRGIG
ncbi:MAG: hypothetical protein ACRD8A_12660 [Candidatus Acidiferrales bacterium]